jgi:hypothetical protein
MKLTKKNIENLVKKNLREMAMDFDSPDRPEQSIQTKLSRPDTPYKKVPLPSSGEETKNFQELMASQRYREVVQNLRRYTNYNQPLTSGDPRGMMPLMQIMAGAHNSIVNTEREHKSDLEKLAIELSLEEFGLSDYELTINSGPNGTTGSTELVTMVVSLKTVGQISTQDFNMQQNNQNIDPVDVEKELMTRTDKVNLEKAKRRLINGIIQGVSKKGHYMYHMVTDKLRDITGSDDLINDYSTLMSGNDTLFWQLSDEVMLGIASGEMGGGGGGAAGKEKVDMNTTPPTIYVEGINFPVLIHECLKGIVELTAIYGQPQDAETFQEVESSEDTMIGELWDQRLGPVIWSILRSSFPDRILVNNKDLQLYVLGSLFKLPAKEFLVFMKEILTRSERSKQLMDTFVTGIENQINNIDAENEIESLSQDLSDLADEMSDDDLDDFLGGLNIGRPEDED